MFVTVGSILSNAKCKLDFPKNIHDFIEFLLSKFDFMKKYGFILRLVLSFDEIEPTGFKC